MTTNPDASAETRTPLNRERVLGAALRLADEVGLAALSMRRLGQALGVEAMSLYNHVANKDDLLNGMVDLVVGEIALPAEGEAWKPAMRRRAISARHALARHPWATPLMESRTEPGPATLRYHDAVLGSLRRAGFPVGLAIRAFSALDSYVFGYMLQETSLPYDGADELEAVADAILERLPADVYPYLAEATVAYAKEGGDDYADRFEFGLDLLLDGLERAAP